jgi:hypothetical protein
MRNKIRTFAAPLPALCLAVLMISCFKKKEENKLLFTPADLNQKQSSFLSGNGLVDQGETLRYIYFASSIEDSGILLTDKKVAVYHGASVEKEMLSTMFDLSTSHSPTPEGRSSITIYRRDDSQFSSSLPGGLTIDGTLFSEIRNLWRAAQDAAGNQAAQDSSEAEDGGIFLGVKKAGEAEKRLR